MPPTLPVWSEVQVGLPGQEKITARIIAVMVTGQDAVRYRVAWYRDGERLTAWVTAGELSHLGETELIQEQRIGFRAE